MVHTRSRARSESQVDELEDTQSLPSIEATEDFKEAADVSVDGHTAVTLGTTSSAADNSKNNERAPLTKEEIALVKKACPAGWLCKGIDYLTSIDSAELISRVVRLWIRIQEHIGWAILGGRRTPTDHSLPVAYRPPIYQLWMKSHRNPKLSSSLKFIAGSFIPQFRRWWTSLQPASRTTPGMTWPLKLDDALSDDWRAIVQGGPNGLYLVTLGLAWQVAFTEEEDTNRKMVQAHISDVEWVYERILDTLTMLPPPADSDSETDEPVKLGKRGRPLSVACEHCLCTGECKRGRK